MDLQKIKDWFDSEEGKKSMADFADKLDREEKIKEKQLEKLSISGNFIELTEKAIKKYNSDKYRDRWYNRGIEPPEDLFWFLFHYSEKYGRVCNEEEWKKYGNMFSSALFYCNGYYFNRMDGQGSVIQVKKQDDSTCLVGDMEEQILNILTEVSKGEKSTKLAQTELLNLFSI